MDPTDLSDAQLDQLADQLAGRLPSGTHGDRVVLSRRAFAAAVGGTLGASGLVALGVDPAAAQAAGQVGTSSSPVDAFVSDLVVQNALQSDLDAGGNKLTNVGSLSTDSSVFNSNFRFGTASETISSGAISYSAPLITVSPEGGTDDNLDDITGAPSWGFLILKLSGTAGGSVTVQSRQGETGSEIWLNGGDFTMDSSYDKLLLFYDEDASRWVELSRANNA